MTPGAVFERVLAGLRARLRARTGALGDPLEPAHLADELHASITPVRDALHRLVGEQLVDPAPGGGFRVPLLTEVALRNLYDWNLRLLLLALGDARRGASTISSGTAPSDAPRRDAEALFLALADLAANPNCAASIAALNERLAPIRSCETELLPRAEVETEIGRMWPLLDQRDWRTLRLQIIAYHRRRLRLVGDLVSALHRPPA